MKRQAEHIPLPDSDDDELIEDRSQSIEDAHEMGNHSESEQELVDEVQSNIHQNAIADHLRSSIKKESCARMAAINARQTLLKTLHSSIAFKAEAEAKGENLVRRIQGQGKI